MKDWNGAHEHDEISGKMILEFKWATRKPRDETNRILTKRNERLGPQNFKDKIVN